MYPPSTQLSPPAPELDTETEDDEDSSDDGYARRPARLSQAALPFVPPPVSSIAPPRRYAPAKLRVSEPQGNPAPTQHGAKKHLLRKWSAEGVSAPESVSPSVQCTSARRSASRLADAQPPSAERVLFAPPFIPLRAPRRVARSTPPVAARSSNTKPSPSPSRGRVVRRARRYPKLLAFDSRGVPVPARVSPPLAKPRGILQHSASPSIGSKVLHAEMIQIWKAALSRKHILMNLRGRKKLAAWLSAAGEPSLASAEIAMREINYNTSLIHAEQAARRKTLDSMDNDHLRMLEAIFSRLESRDGLKNWANILTETGRFRYIGDTPIPVSSTNAGKKQGRAEPVRDSPSLESMITLITTPNTAA